MAVFSLRLPPELDRDARERAERVGISLNALVCVAVDCYLRGGELRPHGRPEVASVLDQLELAKDVPNIGKGPTLGARTGPPAAPRPPQVEDARVKPSKGPKTGPEVLKRQQAGFTLTPEEKSILRAWRESQQASKRR